MRYILLIVHDRRILDSGRHRRLRGSRRQRRRTPDPFEIGVHDNLPVIAQIDGLQLVELLPPLLHVRDIDFVALQIIPGTQMHQHFPAGIGSDHFHIFGIGQVDFTQFAGIARATGVELLHQVVVVLHAGGARRERLAGIHAGNHRERIFFLGVRRQFHERAASIDQGDARSDARKGNRRALVDFHTQAIGHKTHHAGRFNPGNLFELKFALREWDKENVAADVAAHHFHHLRLGDMLCAGNFNLVAGVDAKTPGVFSVAIERDRNRAGNCHDENSKRNPLQSIGSLFGKRTSACRDSFLSAEEWRFLLRFEIH